MKRQIALAGGCLLLLAGWLSAFLSQAIPLQTDFYYLIPALLLGFGIGVIRKLLSTMRSAIVVALMAIVAIITVNQINPGGKISVSGFFQRMEKEAQQGVPIKVEVRDADRRGAFAVERRLAGTTDLRVQLFALLPGGARMLAFDSRGRLYVSLPKLGAIYLLTDDNADGFADQPVLFAADLDRPHGLVWHDEKLYVAESSRLLVLTDENRDNQAEVARVLLDDLPDDGGHWTRSLALGADGYLYLSIGSRCNACEETDPRRATVQKVDPRTGDSSLYASGLRNSVGLAFSGDGRTLWGSENGRDMLGDDLPPDEINRLDSGADYGWPKCFGRQVPDPELNPTGSCADTRPSAVDLPAHSAPLGIAFGNKLNAPPVYRNSLYAALHGSWNRSEPTGYKLVRIPFTDDTPGSPREFLFGWLQDDLAWGRPVAPLVGADGHLYLSDDHANAVYRISWRQKE